MKGWAPTVALRKRLKVSSEMAYLGSAKKAWQLTDFALPICCLNADDAEDETHFLLLT